MSHITFEARAACRFHGSRYGSTKIITWLPAAPALQHCPEREPRKM
jgi:hypothetical protein